jgi:hypothetical protein
MRSCASTICDSGSTASNTPRLAAQRAMLARLIGTAGGELYRQ